MSESLAVGMQVLARYMAEYSYENWSTFAWGSMTSLDGDMVLIVNNEPYEDHALLRDKELNEFRSRFQAKGVREVAYAEYPEQGIDEGFSYALVLKGTRGWVDQLFDWYESILVNSSANFDPRPWKRSDNQSA